MVPQKIFSLLSYCEDRRFLIFSGFSLSFSALDNNLKAAQPQTMKGRKTMKTNLRKSTVTKLIALLAVMALVFSFASCSGKEEEKAVIGISQYAVHGSLDNCRTGFIEGLKEAGLTEGKDFEILYENAGTDDNLNQQIAMNFAAKNVDLMCAISTPSAAACFAAAEDKNIPVVFTAITDPVKAGLTEGNVTGTSDKLPVEAQLELIRSMQPDADTIGIIYTLSEPNSVSAIEEYKTKAPGYGFTIEAIGVAAQSEIALAADTLISKKVDCFSNLTDNNVVEVLDSILEKTDAASIPVYGSEIEQVAKGCVASAGIDYVELGKITGAMAAQIIKGEAKASDMEYKTITEYSTYINSKALASFNITVPADIAQNAVEAE